MTKTVLSLSSLAVSASCLTAALPPEVSISSDLTYTSKYVFRGIEAAEESFQPTLEAAYGDFYAGVWANLATAQDGGTEINYYGGATVGVPNLDEVVFDAGLTVYHYPSSGSNRTHEVYLGAVLQLPEAPSLRPSLYYFRDFDWETDVLEAAVTYIYSLEGIGLPASLDFSVRGGTQGGSSDSGAESYHYYGASLELPFSLNEFSFLKAGLHFSNAEKVAGGDEEFYWSLGYGTFF